MHFSSSILELVGHAVSRKRHGSVLMRLCVKGKLGHWKKLASSSSLPVISPIKVLMHFPGNSSNARRNGKQGADGIERPNQSNKPLLKKLWSDAHNPSSKASGGSRRGKVWSQNVVSSSVVSQRPSPALDRR